MEKESNTNCMNGTATMPSYFPCIKSSERHPLADWLYLKSVITSSPELRMMTETYRKRLAISKQFADQYKPEMPAITVSALMNGYGRQLADFLKPTYMLQLDFDHVKKEEDPALRQSLNNQNIDNVMKRLGFKKIHKKNGNGWAVIEKEGSEINNDSFIDPNDTVED